MSKEAEEGEALLLIARAIKATGYQNLGELLDAYAKGDASKRAEIDRIIKAVKYNPTITDAWERRQ